MSNNDYPISSKDIATISIKNPKDVFFDKNKDGSRYIGSIGTGLHPTEYKFISLYYKFIKTNMLRNSLIRYILKEIKLIDIDTLAKYICASRDIHNLLINKKDNETISYKEFSKLVYNEVHYLLFDKRYKKGARFIDYIEIDDLYSFIDIVYKECCKAIDIYIEETTLTENDKIEDDFVVFDVYSITTNKLLYSYDQLEKTNI